jgi:stage II sporulation protein D
MLINDLTAEPKISVGIIDRSTRVAGRLEGIFLSDSFVSLSGTFSAKAVGGACLLFDQEGTEVAQGPAVRLSASGEGLFRLFNVTIGNQFHWQRMEEQAFRGDLTLVARPDDTITAINEIPLEGYLASVISSEMRATAPKEFLKAHAISSRSWLLAALQRKNRAQAAACSSGNVQQQDEVLRWYEREEHDLFDVCADDHCQRYQGATKIISGQAEAAVSETYGNVILYENEICDARYSKACGGFTEEFEVAWGDVRLPYLASVSDGPRSFDRISTEKDAVEWINSEPDAYCNTRDAALLETILPEIDRQTQGFFRWTVKYSAQELEEILREKSGFDFGVLKEIVPLRRGSSGRISRLRIVGSKMSMVVGKELEIRRWFSRSHLYSSAFVVSVERNAHGQVEAFLFRGAGWGHGVGLCQIGAAVMASQGYPAEEILKHYFQGVEIRKIY